ncbi:MAG: pyrroline-5-carboxylate reductase [Chlamydiota bacterium]
MKIAIFGCGAMGSAFARFFGKSHSLIVFDRNRDKAERLAKETGGRFCEKVVDVVKEAEVILLAVKPKDLGSAAQAMAGAMTKEKVIISVLGGVSLEDLRKQFPSAKLVRTMPNLALTCGKGVIGLVDDSEMSRETRALIEGLLDGVGLSVWLTEKKLDALASLAGSGIGFVFLLIEAMAEGGVYMGLSAQESRELVLQTFEGAVGLVRQTGKHPAELKAQVSSPGGTTIEGLRVMEQRGLRGILMDTLIACYQKGLTVSKCGK